MQIPKIIFLNVLSIMKKILDLAEFRFGKQSDEFKYFKTQIMDFVYNGLKEMFISLQENKQIEKCSCNSNLRHGYTNCEICNGAGFRNVTKNEADNMKIENIPTDNLQDIQL